MFKRVLCGGWIGLVSLVAMAATARGAELSTPPIAARLANVFVTCAIQNTSASSTTARVQIVSVPGGTVVSDSGDQALPALGGLSAAAISGLDCTNGDCRCPNDPSQHCPSFSGTAYCRFVVSGSKGKYRAAGCISTPASGPQSSPTCIEAR